MRVVVLGAGAIGGVLPALLWRARRDVLVLARGAQLAAIASHGLRVERPANGFVARPPVAARADWRDDDLLVVAVKTQDVASALAEHAPPAHVPIACATNGVEAERVALRRARDVVAACVMMPASYLAPGVVQAWASPVAGAIDVGRYPDGAGAPAEALARALADAGFASCVRADIMRWKRGKLVSNLANGAEALCGPEARRSELARAAQAEARACFAAAGLSITSDDEDAARRAGFASQPIAGARRGGGSTWQSLARGKMTLETDYLNGEIALLGRLHGVATPINEALQRVVADAARAGVAPGSWSLAELCARVVLP